MTLFKPNSFYGNRGRFIAGFFNCLLPRTDTTRVMAEHRQTSLAAALFVVCGVGGSIVLFLHPENMDGPVWLGHAASGAFVLAGLAAFCKQHGLRSAFDWLVLAMLVCLFAIGAWVAFGPGFIGFDTGGFVCLSAFGLGASLIGAVAFWQFIRIVRGQSSA